MYFNTLIRTLSNDSDICPNVKQGTGIDRKKWPSGLRKKVSKAGFNGCFRWYVKPVLGDCAKPYLPGTCGGKWRLYHGQPDKSPPIVRRYLDLPHLEDSYHNRYKHQILDASLSLPLTENIQIDMLKRPRPNIGRWAGTCEKCETDCYEDYLGDVVCSECGLIMEDTGRILEYSNGRDLSQILDNPIKCDNGQTVPIGGTEWFSGGDELDYKVLRGYGNYNPALRSFKGEAYLTTFADGFEATTRGKEIICHYCRKHGSYLAHPIWWINPENPNYTRFFCLRCQKETNRVDYPVKWERDDIRIIEAIEQERKYKSYPQNDYRLCIHVNERKEARLDNKINDYVRTQEKEKRILARPSTGNSLFHYQRVLPLDRYLKTAILTTLAAMSGSPYTRKAKGGRPPGNGADSIARWCRINFTSEVPSVAGRVDPTSCRGVISVVFNANSIRKILEKAKPICNKHANF